MTQRDITENRHQGNPESVAAFQSIQSALPRQTLRVLQEIAAAGQRGLTCRELAAAWGVGMNKISGRFSELKKEGLVTKVGVREKSGIVIIAPGTTPTTQDKTL